MTGTLSARFGRPGFWRPVIVLGLALVLAELTGLVTGRHKLIPTEVIVSGLVSGGPAALLALGLVLVYRAGKIINFAQGSLATAAAIVFLTLQDDNFPWIVCVLAAVGGAVIAGILIEVLLIRRFTTSPRLVPTVVTIAAGQLAVALSLVMPIWIFGVDLTSPAATSPDQPSPIPNTAAFSPLTRYSWRWGVEVFTGDHLLAAGVTLLVAGALAVFFRRSRAGIAIRGASENPEKAGTIGINAGILSTLVWVIAAALAGLSAVLTEPLSGGSLLTVGTGFGTETLLAGLAAGVIARMEELPTTAAAAVGLSMFTGAVYFSTTNGADVEVVLLLVLAVALFTQRSVLGRVRSVLASGWAAAEEIRPVPAILRDHPSVRTGRRWLAVIGVVVLAGYPFAMSPTQVFLGSTIAIYGIIAISLVVLTGWGGQISLGQFAFVAVGSCIGGELTAHGWPFLVAWVIATAAGAVVAVVLGLPALRVRGLFLAVITLAFALVVSDFFLDPSRFPWLNPAVVPRPKLFVNFSDDRAFYYLSLAGLAIALLAAQGLRRTRTGRVLIAMRDNEQAAQALGLSLVRVRLTAFAVSGALAAFAGMLYASHERAVRADGYGADQSIQIFLMAVIGGLGSVTGVLTGAIYLGCIQLFIQSTGWQLLASGLGVILILVFFPSGLGGAAYAARDAFLRRVALREKILVPSLLGDLRHLDSEENRAALGAKVGGQALERSYVMADSDIANAGESQRGRGWRYG